MSDFDSNPFADPEAANPFSDPSVRQATQQNTGVGQSANTNPAGMDEYNPFGDKDTTQGPPPQKWAPPPAQQPAVMQPTEQPPAYTPSPAQPAPQINTEDLQRRQEELERKAAELQRKEQEIRNMQYTERRNNFPPLPEKCCVQPCFYQDFEVDIPLEFQRIVKIMYYLWLLYMVTLFLNIIGTLSQLIATGDEGESFAISIVLFVLLTPASFVCWFRPVYKAFRSDSSFNFFLFFFIFFCQFCVTVLQCLGMTGWGTCGWINSLGAFKHNVGCGIVMIIVAILFTSLCVIDMVMLIRIHRIYRSTGASFAKAQDEFRTGVMTNRGVQQAAGSVASAAARTAVEQQMGGGGQGNGGGNRF